MLSATHPGPPKAPLCRRSSASGAAATRATPVAALTGGELDTVAPARTVPHAPLVGHEANDARSRRPAGEAPIRRAVRTTNHHELVLRRIHPPWVRAQAPIDDVSSGDQSTPTAADAGEAARAAADPRAPARMLRGGSGPTLRGSSGRPLCGRSGRPLRGRSGRPLRGTPISSC